MVKEEKMNLHTNLDLTISATFLEIFSAVSLWLGSCFGNFSSFSYFFPWSFPDFGLGWGADLWISAVSATFLWIFPAVSL